MSAQTVSAGKEDMVALATRLALLELLTFGSVPDGASLLGLTNASSVATASSSSSSLQPHESIAARSHEAHERLRENVKGFKPIARFVQEYDANKPYLLPPQNTAGIVSTTLTTASEPTTEKSQTSSSSLSVAQQTVSPHSVIAIALEAEQDLKQLERDLRSLDTYAERDVAGAGKLRDFEALQPRLNDLKRQMAQRLTEERQTEHLALSLMERYSAHVDTQSQLFIHWDQMLGELEDGLSRLERQRR